MNKHNTHRFEEIAEHIADNMEHYGGLDNEDLHHEMFNQDWYIIGTYNAKQWMGSNVFDCIETVQEYEDLNFGERYTDISDPEKLVNMYVYIVGEYIINQLREDADQ